MDKGDHDVESAAPTLRQAVSECFDLKNIDNVTASAAILATAVG